MESSTKISKELRVNTSISEDVIIDSRTLNIDDIEDQNLVFKVEDNGLLIKQLMKLMNKGMYDGIIKLLDYQSQFGDIGEIYEYLQLDKFLFNTSSCASY